MKDAEPGDGPLVPAKRCTLGAAFRRLPVHVVHLILVGFLSGNVGAAMLAAEPDVLYNAIAMNAAEGGAAAVAARSLSRDATVARMIDAVVYDYEYARFVKFYMRVAKANKRTIAKMRVRDVVFVGDDEGLTDNVVLVRKYGDCMVFGELPALPPTTTVLHHAPPYRGAFFVYSIERMARMRFLYINVAATARYAHLSYRAVPV
jgi:hypothetical protein